jgi:hypothetical protein
MMTGRSARRSNGGRSNRTPANAVSDDRDFRERREMARRQQAARDVGACHTNAAGTRRKARQRLCPPTPAPDECEGASVANAGKRETGGTHERRGGFEVAAAFEWRSGRGLDPSQGAGIVAQTSEVHA